MRILFTYLFKNMWEKKLRSLLIILAVGITTAMTFASFGTSDNFKNMVTEKNKAEFGDANIIIAQKESSNNPFLDKDILNKNLEGEEKAYIFNGSGLFKEGDKSLRAEIIAGENIENLQKINPIVFKDGKEDKIKELNGNEVIISEQVSKDLDLKVGDSFKIKSEGKNITLKVSDVAVPSGFFTEKPGEMTIIMSNNGLSKLLGKKEEITSALVKSDKSVETLKKTDLKDYSIKETLNKEDLDSMVSQFTVPFYIMLAIVVLMAAFIIYSSFKVIIIERMAVIGTFRSIGATKKETDGLILLESLFYGIVGCIVGTGLGFPMLYLLSDGSNQFKDYGVSTTVNFDIKNLIIAYIIAIILCLISSIIPILGVSRFSVKEIILGEYSSGGKIHPSFWIIGIVLIIAPFIYISKFEDTGNFILSMACAFFVLIGSVMMIPLIFKILSKVLRGIYRLIFGNIGVLALENMATSKSLINNGVLICSALAAVTAIYVASYSVKNLITNSYDGENYEVSISNITKLNYDEVLANLKDLKGKDIDDYSNSYVEHNVKIKDKDMNIGVLQGINTSKYSEYFGGEEILNDSSENNKKILDKLDSGKKIILADIYKKKYKLKTGDKIELNIDDKLHEYEIAGFLSSPISANKRNCLISEKNFKEDFNRNIPSSILVKGKDISENELKNDLNNDLDEYGVAIKTKEEMKESELANNAGLMSSLESFSIMALIIGALGIVNNLMVSFMQRRKELAVLTSVGMSKGQRSRMIFIEGATIGIFGSILGVFTGILVCRFIPEVSLSLDAYLKITIPEKRLIGLTIFGIVLMLVASLAPVLKASKISVVDEIKYE
ncbi:FtsX-like permease family protein [Clostridium sardiniense]|uniref:FtsX-like permease family protein n=1 Tax=Clostridium sardiniense TaxID=29369 RepID=A0ABS7L2G7_CLOSR|nr:FtsX-like permease family protein [Clostridium sardiniense]MBY0757274.1 FtsX-like permease family protein [Clostridium sardiniense]MDQ0461596.1 putative ABC transport system permease protein [Clostridium sardiniense]